MEYKSSDHGLTQTRVDAQYVDTSVTKVDMLYIKLT